MTRFRFRLDRLLDLRRALEHQQAAALGRAQRAAAEEKRLSDEATRREALAGNQVAEAAGERAPAGMITGLEHARKALAAAAAQLAASAAAAEARAAGAFQRYQDARRSRRSLERLREGRYLTWLLERARREQHELDELNRSRNGQGNR